jgi:hypothetical protein
MNILAAILILSASGSAQRSMEVEQQISGIILRVGVGGAQDALPKLLESVGTSGRTTNWTVLDMPTLCIDNQPRTGWKSWVEAVCRTAGYAADWKHDGSIGYEYRLRIRGYDVRRSTRIENGRVVLTTDAWWTEVVTVGRSVRRIPIHVRIRIDATEVACGTTLVGYASGEADTSDFRCGLVRRLAERQAAATLDRELGELLRVAESGGVRLYHGADQVTGLLDGIGEAMRTIGPRMGRRR